MSNDSIILDPTSTKSANMTNILLSENSQSSVYFEITQIDNDKNPLQKLKGKFVYTKKDTKCTEISKLNKRSVKAGESFELYLTCEETYTFWNKLTEYYKFVEDKSTPLKKITYVKQDNDIVRFKALFEDKMQLEQFLKSIDLQI